jgi:predicted DNA-binding ribbon-helix-helix protein
VVPAYYKEIEKVANRKKITVSKLIRTYILEGMKRDKEISNSQGQEYTG